MIDFSIVSANPSLTIGASRWRTSRGIIHRGERKRMRRRWVRSGRRTPPRMSTYGAPRIQVELAAKGLRIGHNRIARLMAAAGLVGVSRRKFVTTTVSRDARRAPVLVARNFTAEKPDVLWLADITYIPTWAASCIWRWCSTRAAAASSADRWR